MFADITNFEEKVVKGTEKVKPMEFYCIIEKCLCGS